MGIKILKACELGNEQNTVEATHAMQIEAAKEVPFMEVAEPDKILELVRNGALYSICDENKNPLASLSIRDAGIETRGGKKVYILGGVSFSAGKKGAFLSQLPEVIEALKNILEKDYKDKVVISATHERFHEPLEALGFRKTSSREIAENYPELLFYLGGDEEQNSDSPLKWTGFIKE